MRPQDLIMAFSASVLGARAVTVYTTLTRDLNGVPITPTDSAQLPPPAVPLAAYNFTQLTAPPLPNPLPALIYTAQLFSGGMANLSRPTPGNFIGWSIELSVANQMLGYNSTRLAVPFLNHIAALKSRSGIAPNIRIGGNTQERMKLMEYPFPSGSIILKTANPTSANPTVTPDVDISVELLNTLNNISALVDVRWYLGLPFKDPTNTTGIATIASFFEQMLGDRLIALQMGNEPDLYGIGNRSRPYPYQINNLMDEWGAAIGAMQLSNPQILLGPSICCNVDPIISPWSIGQVIAAGFISAFNSQLKVFAVQHYPRDNCQPLLNPGLAQQVFPDYMTHAQIQGLVSPYLPASAAAMAANKPFVMFETNTASCGGFIGLSDSFGAAIWTVDYAMQLITANFTNALFHFGGQNVAYNAFTPPPGTISPDYQWTTSAPFYAMLMVSEALGPSNASQVVDLGLNFGNQFTPGYAIYENGNPTKVLLLNYMADPSGGANTVVNILIGGGNNGPNVTPANVSVRYMAADTLTQKFNITWAGQGMGGIFESDGRLKGSRVTETIQCNPNTGCAIPLKAPSAALVFLTSDALNAATPNESASMTFSTTTQTARYGGGPTVDQAVLQTSNGRGGKGQTKGKSTSPGLKNAASHEGGVVSVGVLLSSILIGAVVVGRVFRR